MPKVAQGRGGRKKASRAKGTGSLERHGLVWRARWIVDGKVVVRSTGTSNRREAEQKLDEFVAPYRLKMDAGKDSAAAKSAGREGMDMAAAALARIARQKGAAAGRLLVPLDKAWDRFDGSLSRNPVSKNVNRIYASRWGVFLSWMKENRPNADAMADVDEETAQAFMRDIKAKSSPKTFNDYKSLLTQIWKVLDKEAGLDGANPWRDIKPLEKETHNRRELTAEELMRVVGPLEGEMRVLFALGIYTGLRLGDCVNLSWGAVDLLRGFIQCKPHKTKKHGTVVRIPLFPALARILAETPAKKRRGLVLPGLAAEYGGTVETDEDGNEVRKPGHPQYTAERVRKAFEAAGIETHGDTGRANPKNTDTTRKAVEVGFHSLRHTFVSLCANAGVPLHIVQAIVGHTNVAMTGHYFHVSDDALSGAVSVLPDVFRSPAAALPAHKGREAVEAVEEVVVEEPDAFETVPASVAKVARMLAGCSPEVLAGAEKVLADYLAASAAP